MTLLWRFPLNRLDMFSDFPKNFICLRDEMAVKAEDVSGAGIWMIGTRDNNRDYLYAHVAAERMFTIEEGIDRGHFLLSLDTLRSFRILPLETERQGHWQVGIGDARFGINYCSDAIQAALLEIMNRNTSRKFNRPRISVPINTDNLRSAEPIIAQSRQLFRYVLRKYAWGDLSLWDAFEEVSPFGAVALKAVLDMAANEEMTQVLKQFDSSLKSSLVSISYVENNAVSFDKLLSEVDTDLIQIDPDFIVARRLIPGETLLSYSESVARTEQAEARHQQILRGVSEYLVSIGVTPYQTRSVDLACKSMQELSLLEIKSATATNYETQVEKGIFQLLKYTISFEDEGFRVARRVLVVDQVDANLSIKNANSICRMASIDLLHYDEALEWQEKLSSLIRKARREQGCNKGNETDQSV